MKESCEDFIRQIVSKCPWLQPILDLHLSDNFGCMLPHLIMYDIYLWVEVHHEASNRDSDIRLGMELGTVLNALEEGLSGGSSEVQELISVSFLENLPRPGGKNAEIRSLLGPVSARELGLIQSWKPFSD